jgi:hypothetical protein
LASLEPLQNQGERDQCKTSLMTGEFPAYVVPECSGQSGQTFNSAAALESVGIKGLSVIPVVGPFLSSIGGTILSVFTGHHAAAVRTERLTLCKAVPGAHQFLQTVDLAFEQGNVDAAGAARAMDDFLSQWRSAVGAIYQTSPCNAACAYSKYIEAAMQYRKNKFAAYGNGIMSGSIFSRPTNDVQYSSAGFWQANASGLSRGSLAVAGLLVLGIGLFVLKNSKRGMD